jgi:hypothetical protein
MAYAGCSPPDEPIGSARQPIVNGYASQASDNSIVMLVNNGTGEICTASLVAPNLLLTAIHCVVSTKMVDGFICALDGTLENPSLGMGVLSSPTSPANIQIYVGQTVPTVPFGSGEVAPGRPDGGPPDAYGQQILTTGSTTICHGDIAFVVLDRDLAQSFSLTPLSLRVNQPVQANETVSVVGYGMTTETPNGQLFSPTRYRLDSIIVEFANWLPGTFTTGPCVCKGDSGGPALDVNGAVVGEYSQGGSPLSVYDCQSSEQVNYFVQVADYGALVVDAFNAAGQSIPPGLLPDGGAVPPDAGADAAGISTLASDAGVPDGSSGGAGGGGETGGSGGASEGEVDAGETHKTSTKSGGCSLSEPNAGSWAPFALALGLVGVGLRRRKIAAIRGRQPWA